MGAEEEAGRTQKYAGEIKELARRKELAWEGAGCLLGADAELCLGRCCCSSLSAPFQVASSLLLHLFIYSVSRGLCCGRRRMLRLLEPCCRIYPRNLGIPVETQLQVLG